MGRNRSKSKHAKVALTRLIEDEQLQKQLRTGTLRLQEAWSRASRRPASKAVEDKKIYSKVQEAASSFASAGRRLRKQAEPPKRRARKAILGLAIAGGAVFAAKKKKKGSATATATTDTTPYTPPVVPAATPTSSTPQVTSVPAP